MQKGNLKCNATDCAYNQNYECKAGRIHVSGRGAVSIEGTSCTTFLDKDNSSLVNSILGDSREKESFFNESNSSFVNNVDNSTTEPSNIKCEAHNCIYNQNKECHAEKVQIDKDNAYCYTFNYKGHI